MPDENAPSVREQLDAELDKQLLDVLQNGVQVVTKDGAIATIKAPHQYFDVARKRLADLGMTKEVALGDDAARIAKEIGLDNSNIFDMRLPEVSEEDDAATA